jgi:hypothetical protein
MGRDLMRLFTVMRHPTFERRLYGEGETKESNVTHLEIHFRPEGFPTLPGRPFVMPCRSLCGLDLKRVHWTCLFTCRYRRIHVKQIPPLNELQSIYRLYILKQRRLAAAKDALLRKIILPLAEACAN